MLQLHGHETPQRVAAVRESFGLPVMKVLPIEAKSDLLPIGSYTSVADRLLFDARAPREATRPGGLGKPFDWHLLENLDLSIPFMLSGGLECRERRAKRCGSRALPASMSPPASKARPA